MDVSPSFLGHSSKAYFVPLFGKGLKVISTVGDVGWLGRGRSLSHANIRPCYFCIKKTNYSHGYRRLRNYSEIEL